MKWNVRLIYKDIIEVEVEATSKEEAIANAIDCQEKEGVQVDYYWSDAEVEQA